MDSLYAHFALERLDDRLYVAVEPGGGSNAGIILGADGPVIVDALLSPEAGEELRRAVGQLTDRPPRFLIYTHHHGDHTFGAQAFDCPVIAHEAAGAALRTGGDGPSPDRRLALFYGEHFARAIGAGRPDTDALRSRFERLDLSRLTPRAPGVLLTDRLTIHDPAGDIHLMALGHAHSAGDIAVFLPGTTTLFAGDLAFSGRMPFMAEPVGETVFRVLERMEALAPLRVVPGHGPVGGPEILRTMLRFFTDLRDAVSPLRDEGQSLEEVKARLALPQYADWPRYEAALPLNAEMVYLGLDTGILEPVRNL